MWSAPCLLGVDAKTSLHAAPRPCNYGKSAWQHQCSSPARPRHRQPSRSRFARQAQKCMVVLTAATGPWRPIAHHTRHNSACRTAIWPRRHLTCALRFAPPLSPPHVPPLPPARSSHVRVLMPVRTEAETPAAPAPAPPLAPASLLAEIVAPVGADMDQMNRNLRNVVGSRHPMLVAAADQIFGAGGKKLRPMVVFLVARATAELAGLE
jgi:hypothetical protein